MTEHFTRPNIEKVIGKLGTTPEQRGLSTQEFKDKFDEMPEAIQQYIKETLLAELDAFKQEFMTQQQWINSRHQNITGDVLAWALTCDKGITSFYATEPVSNIPTRTYSLGFVLKTAKQVSHIFIADRLDGKVYKNTYNSSSQAWLGWRKIDMTAV